MSDLSAAFSRFNTLNAEVNIFRTNYGYVDLAERWTCSVAIKNEGSELKVQGRAATGEEAVLIAAEKLSALISSPAVSVTFAVPVLAFDGEVTSES